MSGGQYTVLLARAALLEGESYDIGTMRRGALWAPLEEVYSRDLRLRGWHRRLGQLQDVRLV